MSAYESRPAQSTTLALAAALARKGRLTEAEELLAPLASGPSVGTDTLDLLARVYAQQRKIPDAREVWLRALQIEPANKHFLRALLRCAQLCPND